MTVGLHSAERRERGAELCRRLGAEVAELAPPGIRRWEPVWEITAPSDAAFMEALTAWEADPGSATLNVVRQAYGAALEAWRRASGEYGREGTGQ